MIAVAAIEAKTSFIVPLSRQGVIKKWSGDRSERGHVDEAHDSEQILPIA
jgi:hypothetical protein